MWEEKERGDRTADETCPSDISASVPAGWLCGCARTAIRGLHNQTSPWVAVICVDTAEECPEICDAELLTTVCRIGLSVTAALWTLHHGDRPVRIRAMHPQNVQHLGLASVGPPGFLGRHQLLYSVQTIRTEYSYHRLVGNEQHDRRRPLRSPFSCSKTATAEARPIGKRAKTCASAPNHSIATQPPPTPPRIARVTVASVTLHRSNVICSTS